MKYLSLMFVLVLFNGCGIVKVQYQSEKSNIPKYQQKVENEQCVYLLGPFNLKEEDPFFELEKKEGLKKLIKDTIVKANNNGLYGNKLVNINIKEGGYTSPIVSKLCLYISANLVYDKFLDQ